MTNTSIAPVEDSSDPSLEVLRVARFPPRNGSAQTILAALIVSGYHGDTARRHDKASRPIRIRGKADLRIRRNPTVLINDGPTQTRTSANFNAAKQNRVFKE